MRTLEGAFIKRRFSVAPGSIWRYLVFVRYAREVCVLEYGRDPHFYSLFWPISFVYTTVDIVKGIMCAVWRAIPPIPIGTRLRQHLLALSAMVKVSKSSIVSIVPRSSDYIIISIGANRSSRFTVSLSRGDNFKPF